LILEAAAKERDAFTATGFNISTIDKVISVIERFFDKHQNK
jgi:hypothetical protein